VKKLIATVVILACSAACHSSPAPVNAPAPAAAASNATGASDAANAVRGFLAAAKAQDLQAMGMYFGNEEGPARDVLPRDELEKREIIMAGCLQHDHFDIIGDAPGTGGARVLAVQLAKPGRSASVNFETVMSPRDRRWYIKSFDLPKLMQEYCTRS
jgi:hypothetical protein